MTIKDLKPGNYFYYNNKLYLKTKDMYVGDKIRTYNVISLNDHDGHGCALIFKGNEVVILAKNLF